MLFSLNLNMTLTMSYFNYLKIVYLKSPVPFEYHIAPMFD